MSYSRLNYDMVKTIIVDHFNEMIDKYPILIESGTSRGNSTISLQPYFNEIHTVELSYKYYNISSETFQELGFTNVKSYLGDSINVLPKILQSMSAENKCIFFLDGHFSSLDTAKGKKDCPVLEECSIINSLYVPDETILLIDDYRLFDTKKNEDWSGINTISIKKCFNNFEIINECIDSDIFCLHIKKLKK